MSRAVSSATIMKGELSRKSRFLGRWENRIFELGTDDGEITLSCCKSEHSNLENIWTVVGVTSIKDLPKQLRYCFDVSMANGKTVALSAHTADEKKHWLKASRRNK